MASNKKSKTKKVLSELSGGFDASVITDDDRKELSHHVAHIAHMLSEQGPMSITFVHNNTLLGLQSLHFEDAIKKSEAFSGGRGFLENDAYRDYHLAGRITDGDIKAALANRSGLSSKKNLVKTGLGKISSGNVHYLNMVHGLDAISVERIVELFSGNDRISKLEDNLDGQAIELLKQYAGKDAKDLSGIKNTKDFAEWLNKKLGIKLADDENAQLSKMQTELRERFDIDATPQALAAYIMNSPESWIAQAQWASVLTQLGLEGGFLDDNESLIDLVAEDENEIAQNNGALIPIDAEMREQINKIVTSEIAAIEKAKNRTSDSVRKARIAWTILHGLSEGAIKRQAFSALNSLLLERGAKSGLESKLLQNLRLLDPRRQMTRYAEDKLTSDLASLQAGDNHADFIQKVTGEDVVKNVNDYMIGVCSSFLDEGLAAWHMPSRATGFFDSWRNLVRNDRTFDFDGITDWRRQVDKLPLNATDAVISQLVALGIEQSGWADYCGRSLAHLRGWAGMIFWRQENSDYGRQQAQPIDLMQYLAVRLFYQNLLVTKVCNATWNLQPGMENLNTYFGSNLDEYFVRRELYENNLSDHLAQQARALISKSKGNNQLAARWESLADIIWAQRVRNEPMQQAADIGWRLYRLTQHLGMTPDAVNKLSAKELDALINTLNEFQGKDHGPVWLHAFEKNYRDEICNALALNRGRGRWLDRKERPKSQIVFCIDEREESIHRHYEELDPGHETMGAAGFFGVAMEYRGLDEHDITPLCPAPVTPEHRILEVARSHEEGEALEKHTTRAKWAEVAHDTYWEMKRNPISSYFLIDVTGFLMAIPLIGRMFFPLKYFSGMDAIGKAIVPEVDTQLAVSRNDALSPSDLVHAGFTEKEQADRVEGLLRNIGLLEQFAPIVVICAHGSSSENNPYINAYDCGACGGKGGEPNSRAVAVMANNPKVRKILAKRGIKIPDDTWFVGALHNTATEIVTLSDEVDVPEKMRPQYDAVKRDLDEAVRRAARERCRRFASAPKDASLDTSLKHTMERASDFSQIRPELGHATNACAVVGRRALTQGIFFDRRSFIISYDPTTDPKGEVLERILLAVGPVGAGINLEYYFSTVDPAVYGSDSKVPHNISGLIGVMEGAHSDLRTGLPRQMTEVHEPMRLHLIVDANPAIAGEIYGRQPAIQQLLDNEWVLLIVHDPDTGDLLRFVPGVGFEKWDDSKLEEIPEVDESFDWFKGKYQCFLPPARITEPTQSWLKEA